MKTNPTKSTQFEGVDERYLAKHSKAGKIKNLKVDPEGLGLSNECGWEPLHYRQLNPTGLLNYTQVLNMEFKPCRALSVWARHDGAEVYYLKEADGVLNYAMGNRTSLSVAHYDHVTLSSGRHEPKPNEIGTQFIPYGRFNLIINGYDEPFMFFGRGYVRPFGFRLPTPTPSVMDVEPDYYSNASATTDDKTCIHFSEKGTKGLGNSAVGDANTYRYKMSFITDTGSESPLSDAAVVNWTITAGNEGRYGVMLNDVPTGPKGTVARRIYRTPNLEDGQVSGKGVFYFVKQIDDNITKQWTDIISDSHLTIEAPSIADSVILGHGHNVGTEWDNRLWIAKGNKVLYSDKNKPEQFGAFNYFDMGIQNGGHVTAIVPYYSSLIVFRENSISMIRPTTEGYTIGQISGNIGTSATNTIKVVPNVGVMFLTKKGLYNLSGGLQGGSQVSIQAITTDVTETIQRISANALPRATATYSSKEQEYWCHFPIDGDTENSMGIVLHTQTGQYSLRYTDNRKDMKFTQLDTDPEGWIIIGTIPRETTGSAIPENQIWKNVGLQVWSAINMKGYIYQDAKAGFESPHYEYQIIEGDTREEALYESVWMHLGINQKIRVSSIEVDIITQGNNQINFEYGIDETDDWNTTKSVQQQVPDRNNDVTYGVTGTTQTDDAIINTSDYGDNRYTRLRFDVSTRQVRSFRFRLKSTSVFHVVSYNLHMNPGQRRTVV